MRSAVVGRFGGDMTDDVSDLSAVDLVEAYAARTLSPVEVVEAVTERIARAEPVLKALYAYDPERALKAAAASERRWLDGAPCGPLDGVPITLKENIATAGEPVPLGTAAT